MRYCDREYWILSSEVFLLAKVRLQAYDEVNELPCAFLRSIRLGAYIFSDYSKLPCWIEIPHKDLKGQTRVVALTDGKGNYRILVIGLTKDNEAEFELSPDFGSLTSHTKLTENKNGIWTFKGKAFSCDLLE